MISFENGLALTAYYQKFIKTNYYLTQWKPFCAVGGFVADENQIDVTDIFINFQNKKTKLRLFNP